MHRVWILAVVAACGGSSTGSSPDSSADSCPTETNGANGDVVEGSPCSSSKTCFVENQFSSCASGYYTCVAGKWHLDHDLGATEGASCTDAPLQSCSIEGNPSCTTLPTSGACGCGTDGLWHCDWSCYGAQTTGDPCPATSARAVGRFCDPAGYQCTYPDATCTCGDDGHGGLAFSCS